MAESLRLSNPATADQTGVTLTFYTTNAGVNLTQVPAVAAAGNWSSNNVSGLSQVLPAGPQL